MNRVFRVVWNSSLGLWAVASERASGAARSGSVLSQAAGALLLMAAAGGAAADCVQTGVNYNCSAGAPHGTIVGSGDGTSGATIDLLPNAVINAGEQTAISVGSNSVIRIQARATVQNGALGATNGIFGTGANTVEMRSGNTLTIEQFGRVLSTGTAGNAEAINPIGIGNTIVNHGEIRSQAGGAAIWFESSSGANTVVNGATGIIEYRNGAGNIMGVQGTMAIDFTNQGELRGDMNFANGNDTLRIHTGSSISGAVNAGGGSNTLVLGGTGIETFTKTVTGFQTLVKDGTSTWTFGNALTGSSYTSTRVAGGTLVLGTNASAYAGSVTVDAGGTLQTTAAFAPAAITDNGLVRFAQPTDADYAGLLSGTGGIEKTGAGVLTLLRDQAITGTTTINGGTLALGNGSNTTGMVHGPIVDNAVLEIHRSDAVTFAAPISGTGHVVQRGAGTTTFTADNSYTGGTTISGGTLALGDGGTSGSVVGDILNNAALEVRRTDTLALAGRISGSGSLRQAGSGTTVLSGANSYLGPTVVAAGTLRAGAGGAFSPASAHVVAAGATLDTGGFNQGVAALLNAGTVSLRGGVAGSSLTVTGAYVGQNGVLSLNTALGSSASASDRLVLSGVTASASGRTTVQVNNLGGLGARTTGSGIEVVAARNGATTTAQSSRDAFALANGHVDAGAYEYRLYAADAQGAGESWYLRSEAILQPPGTPLYADPAEGQEAGGKPPVPAASVPTYRAEVPLFAALPAQLRQGDLAMLGNLHRRVGDETAPGRQAWARAVYTDLDIRQGGSAAARSEGHASGLQAGTDLLAGGGWRAGLYVGTLEGGADVSGNARGVFGAVGHNDLQSRYLGGYATWMQPESGWYADTVLQAGSHRYTVQPDGNPSAAGKARSTTASIETGRAIALGGGWSFEPQAQLAWQRSRFDDVQISGARVTQDADGGFIGRLGVRVKGDISTAAGRLQPYGRANVYRAGAGTDVATFIGPAASTPIASASGYTSTELAGGFSLALSPATTLYGEAGRLFSAGGDARVQSSVQGSLGVRVQW